MYRIWESMRNESRVTLEVTDDMPMDRIMQQLTQFFAPLDAHEGDDAFSFTCVDDHGGSQACACRKNVCISSGVYVNIRRHAHDTCLKHQRCGTWEWKRNKSAINMMQGAKT